MSSRYAEEKLEILSGEPRTTTEVMKECKRCSRLLPVDDFYNKVSPKGKIYKRGVCKNCF